MPTCRLPKILGSLGLVVVTSVACGQSSGGDPPDQETSAKPGASTPAAAAQDLCAQLGDEAVRKIEATLGKRAKVEEYDGEVESETYLPAVDTCELSYRGADVPEPTPEEGQREVVRQGRDSGDGDLEFRLTIAPMTMKDYRMVRDGAKDSADEYQAPVSDVSGVGDAAFYNNLEPTLYVDGRMVQVLDHGSGVHSKAQFAKIAEAILPTLRGLPQAPAEVTRPICDSLTKAAEAAVQRQVEVRRDNEHGSRTFCGWAAHTRSFQVDVATDDDPVRALRKLREEAKDDKVDVGDEGYYVTDPARQVIFREGDRHYQAYFWSTEDGPQVSKAETVAAVQRFAEKLE